MCCGDGAGASGGCRAGGGCGWRLPASDSLRVTRKEPARLHLSRQRSGFRTAGVDGSHAWSLRRVPGVPSVSGRPLCRPSRVPCALETQGGVVVRPRPGAWSCRCERGRVRERAWRATAVGSVGGRSRSEHGPLSYARSACASRLLFVGGHGWSPAPAPPPRKPPLS